MASLLCGIFVGGQSRRMGGHPKGLLPAPTADATTAGATTAGATTAGATTAGATTAGATTAGAPTADATTAGAPTADATTADATTAGATTLVARLAELALAQGLPVVLVGQRPEYAGLGLPLLADRPAGHGPLGGLAALLYAASEQGLDGAVALSCDLPFLGPGLLSRLVATPAGDFVALAPRWQPSDRDTPIWEPLCARYAVAFLPYLEQAMAQGARSLQSVLSQAQTQPLVLSPDEQAQVRDWDRPEDLPPALRSAVRARPQ